MKKCWNTLGKLWTAVLLLCCVLPVSGCETRIHQDSWQGESTPPPSMEETASQPMPREGTFFLDYIYLSLRDLTLQADTIVYGEVTGILPAIVPDEEKDDPAPLIYTPVEVTPILRHKGNPTINPVVYYQPGGVYQGIKQAVDHGVNLQTGQRVVLFLTAHHHDMGGNSVLVEEDGQITYLEDGTYQLVSCTPQEFLERIARYYPGY